ncbi:MAG: DPP IV N-terminal domain-containing protein [Candidatus Moduliflexus flocculans]|nr:DPP IV N-terminal domain-containing protein [Candidatus Moduliflexus flocculans]
MSFRSPSPGRRRRGRRPGPVRLARRRRRPRRAARGQESQLRPGLALDAGQGRQARLRHGRLAPLAGDGRPLLVQLRNGPRPQVVHRRSGRPVEEALFDNVRMAAQLTRILLVPYDAQHLPIKTIKFIKKDTAIQFEIEVPKDNDILVGGKIVKASEIAKEEEKVQEVDKEKDKEKEQDTQKDKGKEADKPKEPEKKTKVLAFTYELATGKLALIEDYKEPLKRPEWADVSPDEKTVVFARGDNLFLMDAASFELAKKKADDKAVQEVQLTTDGEEHYSYARTLNDEDKEKYQKDEKDRKDFRRPAGMVVWSKDSKRIALVRSDERKVADLWVINALAEPRPTLETYRYEMPGEENQPQPEILIFDLATKAMVKVKAEKFKDPTLDIFTAPRHGPRPGEGVPAAGPVAFRHARQALLRPAVARPPRLRGLRRRHGHGRRPGPHRGAPQYLRRVSRRRGSSAAARRWSGGPSATAGATTTSTAETAS